MFCKHDWKVLSETTTESKIEHVKNVGGVVAEGNIAFGFFIRKHIQVFKCDRCGKLKRFVEDI